MQSNINKKRFLANENTIYNQDLRFRDNEANRESFTDKQIDDIIENIIKNANPEDYLEPLSKTIIPRASNKMGLKKTFYHKQYYRHHGFPNGAPYGSQDTLEGINEDDMSDYQGESRYVFPPFNSIDFNHQKAFYGRIDTHNRSIYPSEKFLKLVSGTDDVMLLNFVSEALSDMLFKIERMKEIGKIPKSSIFYNITVKKGWESLLNDHHKTMNAIFEGFILNYVNNPLNSVKIRNFQDYSKEFIYFLNKFLVKFPITRSRMQLNNATNPRVSGLVFEIATDVHDDDESKYRNYILDKSFIQFQGILNSFGFMVDKNAPWRIIADLESPQMRFRMAEKGFETLQDMFDGYYYKTHLYEVNTMKKYFFSYYDSYINSYPTYFENYKCGNGVKTRAIMREKRVEDKFTDKKLLQFYYFIKAKEAKLSWTQEEFDFAFEEAYEVYKYYGLVPALHHIADKTTIIVGKGENYGFRTKKEENYRIIHNHQSYHKRSIFTINL